MKRIKTERFILVILIIICLLALIVSGLDAEAKELHVKYLKYQNGRQAAIIHDRNVEIELLNMLLDQREEPKPKETYIGEFTVTFYCSCYKCCGKTDGITASGTIAQEGQTVAADWDALPPGTRIFIEGIGFRTVEDSGGWIKGNKLDVYMESHQVALDAGVVQAKVYIVED